jgi:hypothetical protein
MILFVYGLFGFAYAVIITGVFYFGPCNARVSDSLSSKYPPLELKINVQPSPLGFGLSMGKLHRLSAD